MVYTIHLWTLFLGLLFVDHCSCECRDLDTTACEHNFQHNPVLCKDETLAITVCPRFCNLCPLKCYHCEGPVKSHTDCNSTKVCQIGEQCMVRELTSSIDGHHEYQMNCASVYMCNGNWITSLGKRNVVTQCCSSDLCNNPGYHIDHVTSLTNPTTTAVPTFVPPVLHEICNRDIEFLIEDSRNSTSSSYILPFIQDIVGQIDIGPTANQVAVSLFDSRGLTGKIAFTNHYSKADLLNQIGMISFSHRTDQYDESQILRILQNSFQDGKNGDRQGYKDVVVVIADHVSRNNGRDDRFISNRADQKASTDYDVIVINVGFVATSSAFSSLASSSSHLLNVVDFPSLRNIVAHIISLLCM